MNWATSRLSTWIGDSSSGVITRFDWMALSSLTSQTEIPYTAQAVRFACSRLDSTKVARFRYAPLRFELLRFAQLRSAALRFAPPRFAPLRFAVKKLAP